jgi:DNA-binding FrmR family transcriptional regulator
MVPVAHLSAASAATKPKEEPKDEVNVYGVPYSQIRAEVEDRGRRALSGMASYVITRNEALQNDFDTQRVLRNRLAQRAREGAPVESLRALAQELQAKNKAVLEGQFAGLVKMLPEPEYVANRVVLPAGSSLWGGEPTDEAELLQYRARLVNDLLQEADTDLDDKVHGLAEARDGEVKLQEDLAAVEGKPQKEAISQQIRAKKEEMARLTSEVIRTRNARLRDVLQKLEAKRDFFGADKLIPEYLYLPCK